jgi:hypothetical protein
MKEFVPMSILPREIEGVMYREFKKYGHYHMVMSVLRPLEEQK